MAVNADFRDLFRILRACRVRYLVAGAHAVMYHSEPRYTKDLDIWVEPRADNAAQVWAALEQFGAPLSRTPIHIMPQAPSAKVNLNICPRMKQS